MIEQELLYKILDFEVNWNKYHLVKQYGYVFRLQQIIDLFNKLGISDNEILFNSEITQNLRPTYNFVKNGDFLNHVIDDDLLQGVSYRLKNIIKNSELQNKYPYFIDLDFNYQNIFQKLIVLRCSLFRLENKFNNPDRIENIELDIEQILYKKMLIKIIPDIKEIDIILSHLLNPYNKNINPNDVLHYNIDFNQFNII